MNILIIYDGQEAVIASYWEWFFKSCGIWVEKREYRGDLEQRQAEHCLIILRSEFLERYQNMEDIGVGHVFLVVGEEKLYYKNNIISQREDNSAGKIMNHLFGDNSKFTCLDELFKIYSGNNFWMACWLYEELGREGIKRWDTIITEICEEVLRLIEIELRLELDNIYVQYMRFYCQYIRCGVYRSSSMRLVESKNLLKNFLPLLKKNDKEEMYFYLAGRICELNFVENKQAVYFYRKAAKRNMISDFLYDIGHSLEKVFGDDEHAIVYYRRAYLNDKSNYRALYKLALDQELRRQWTEAFNLYSRIVRQLQEVVEDNYAQGNAASVKEVDYLYKAYKRLLYIYRQIFGCGDTVNGYTEKIEAVERKLETGYSFNGIASYMGDEALKTEIAEEIKEKFKGKCYQS